MKAAAEAKKAEKFLKAAGVAPRPTAQGLLFADLGLPVQPKTVKLVFSEVAEAKGVRSIALKQLQPDPNNPRKKLGDLGELVASLKEHGVIEPLVVRPIGEPHARGDKFMIVVGHRRRAGAAEAGLSEVPCIVRPMTDAQALELQLIENAQRKDLQPLEEADAYARLAKDHGYTADDIASRVGRKKGVVIARLKLRALCPEGRTSVAAGTLDMTLAVAVARIKSPEAQAKFLDRAQHLPLRSALALLHSEHARSLKAPPFDPKDSDLVPAAGPCTRCPFRSGATPGYADDLKGHDSCTKPSCFDQKAKLTWDAKVAKFKKAELEVLTISKGQALFRYGGQLQHDGEFVEVDTPAPGDPKKRTWAQLIEKIPKPKAGKRFLNGVELEGPLVKLVIAADAKLHPRKLYRRSEALQALSQFGGHEWAYEKVAEAEAEASPAKARETYAAQQIERQVRNLAAATLVARIVDKTKEVQRPEAMLMAQLIDEGHGGDDALWGDRPQEERERWLREEATLPQLLKFSYHALLLETLGKAWQGYDERLLQLAERHGLDLRMTENAIKRELADEEIAKAAPAEAPAPVAEPSPPPSPPKKKRRAKAKAADVADQKATEAEGQPTNREAHEAQVAQAVAEAEARGAVATPIAELPDGSTVLEVVEPMPTPESLAPVPAEDIPF